MFRWVTRWLHRGCRREYVSLLKRLGEAERASWRIVDSDGDSVTVEFGERVMAIKRTTEPVSIVWPDLGWVRCFVDPDPYSENALWRAAKAIMYDSTFYDDGLRKSTGKDKA